MNLEAIPAFNKKCIRVIIETPKLSKVKYSYDPELEVMIAGTEIPDGMIFPFDFGFVPTTKGEDGDPLDALVLMDSPGLSGAMIECRLLGVIRGDQKNGKRRIENDRFLFVPADIEKYEAMKSIKDIPKDFLQGMHDFLVSYNKDSGKAFRIVGVVGPRQALRLLKKGIQAFGS